MELPNVDNRAVDRKTGVLYNVKAYRTLKPDELQQIIRQFMARIPKNKRPKRGDEMVFTWLDG